MFKYKPGSWQSYDYDLCEYDAICELAEELNIPLEDAREKLALLRDEAMTEQWEVYYRD